jgi:predicted nucleic acid-binding protein
MKVALDTNVLAYAEGANGAAMRDRALEVIQRLPVGAVVLPVQTLGELFNVLVRKAKRRPARAGSRAEQAGCLSDGGDVRDRNG